MPQTVQHLAFGLEPEPLHQTRPCLPWCVAVAVALMLQLREDALMVDALDVPHEPQVNQEIRYRHDAP